MSGAKKILEQISTPVWVYSVSQGRIAWANPRALAFWKAETVEALRKRDMRPVSPGVQRRFDQYLVEFKCGRDTWENWTFYPKDEPTTVFCRASGIEWNGETAVLFEAHLPEEMKREFGEDFNRTILLFRDMPVAATLLSADGTAVFQNPTADRTFGRLEDAPFWNRFTARHEIESLLASAWEKSEAPMQLMAVNSRNDVAWFQFGAQRMRDPASGAPSVLVYGFDVTEQELMREAFDIPDL